MDRLFADLWYKLLVKVFNAWAKRKGVNMDQYRFLTGEGQRVNPTDTPAGVKTPHNTSHLIFNPF